MSVCSVTIARNASIAAGSVTALQTAKTDRMNGAAPLRKTAMNMITVPLFLFWRICPTDTYSIVNYGSLFISFGPFVIFPLRGIFPLSKVTTIFIFAHLLLPLNRDVRLSKTTIIAMNMITVIQIYFSAFAGLIC